MNPERFRQIDQVLQTALEQAADKRRDFLQAACAGDEALRSEVETLLRAHEQAGSFLRLPALETVARMVAEQPIVTRAQSHAK
jgi:eukaryotic-like serine/threonine-protein kinase